MCVRACVRACVLPNQTQSPKHTSFQLDRLRTILNCIVSDAELAVIVCAPARQASSDRYFARVPTPRGYKCSRCIWCHEVSQFICEYVRASCAAKDNRCAIHVHLLSIFCLLAELTGRGHIPSRVLFTTDCKLNTICTYLPLKRSMSS
jgi:hypothetical protein